MNKKIFTSQEIINMGDNRFKSFNICLRAGAYGLIGFPWTKWISVYRSHIPGEELIIEWE